MLKFKDYLIEKKVPKPTGGLKDACWTGYTAVGMKMKDGRKVPNCVPEETELSEATVKTQKYSWGTMKTIHHGSDFSIPLHPEHHHEIAKLGDEQEHKFKDETGRHWTARRKGEDVHFHSANDGPKTVVKHSDLKEEVERFTEEELQFISDHYEELDEALRHKRAAMGIAAAMMAVERGALIVRTHDVSETMDALKIWQAMREQELASFIMNHG